MNLTEGSSADPGARPTPRPKDFAWSTMAAVFLLFLGVQVFAFAVLVISTEFSRLLGVAVGGVCSYWFMMGAWRRTVWGAVGIDRRQPGPQVLSERTARVYVAVALVGALALVIAVAVQLLLAHRQQ